MANLEIRTITSRQSSIPVIRCVLQLAFLLEFAVLMDRFQVAEWVADAVLMRDDSKKRAAVLKQFIAVADVSPMC